MAVFFNNSRPDRQKRAMRETPRTREQLLASPIPPAKTYELLTTQELFSGVSRTMVFDVESYPNYFLVSFKCLATGKIIYFEDSPVSSINTELLSFVLHRFNIVGFNSASYDLPIVMCAIKGLRATALYQVTREIISEGMRAWHVQKKYGGDTRNINHIDLIDVAPITASLKIYSGRIHCERMQDLPYPFDTDLTYEQACVVRDYNVNDLDLTERLFNFLKPQLDLRDDLSKDYKQDLRSKSDAQIGEAVIISELAKIGIKAEKPKYNEGYTFFYKAPDFIKFKTPSFKRALELFETEPFTLNAAGQPICPKSIEQLMPTLNGMSYALGVGGLHSTEKSISHFSDENYVLIDKDVASYYPSIILILGLFPLHLGRAFLDVFRILYERRLKGKRDKIKAIAEGLKIVINGIFGKLGSWYAKVFAPELMLNVTITGQLGLMMFIETIAEFGIEAVSANTDGVVLKCPRNKYADLEKATIIWEEATGFVTEETRYKSIHCRDVNNYIAVKEDGGCKLKGFYAEVGSALNSPLSKNPESYICSMAAQEFLEKGTPIEQTILNHGRNIKTDFYTSEISRFVNVRSVEGGGEKSGVYLGKAVRWYYGKNETGTINYVGSGNSVANTEGAKPLMILPANGNVPDDVDYDKYINDANDILYQVGFYTRPTKMKLF